MRRKLVSGHVSEVVITVVYEGRGWVLKLHQTTRIRCIKVRLLVRCSAEQPISWSSKNTSLDVSSQFMPKQNGKRNVFRYVISRKENIKGQNVKTHRCSFWHYFAWQVRDTDLKHLGYLQLSASCLFCQYWSQINSVVRHIITNCTFVKQLHVWPFIPLCIRVNFKFLHVWWTYI